MRQSFISPAAVKFNGFTALKGKVETRGIEEKQEQNKYYKIFSS